MPDRPLSYDEVMRILQLVESSSQFSEFHLQYGDLVIDVRKHSAGPRAPLQASATPQAQVEPPRVAQVPTPPATAQAPHPETTPQAPHPSTQPVQGAAAPAPPTPPQPAPSREQALPEGLVAVKSPMVGTFYRAPEPGAAPFVDVGQRVSPDTIVCIIEVMKLMNSIPAGQAGVVRQVLADDAQAVEFGQALILIEPDA